MGWRSGARSSRARPPPNRLSQPFFSGVMRGSGRGFFGGGRAREDLAPLRHPTDGHRYEEPAPRMIQSGGQAAALKPQAEPEAATDDLDIPSFLRRLAN